MKLCRGCGEVKAFSDFGRSYDRESGESYIRSRCKLCVNQAQKDYARSLGAEYLRQRSEIKKKRKTEDPVRFLVQERIASWRKADKGSDLTTDYLVTLWHEQKGICYYTGVEMILGGKAHPQPTSASLDKLDPAMGYRKGNVVWACYQANTSKGSRNERAFYDFCRLVLRLAEGRQELNLEPAKS